MKLAFGIFLLVVSLWFIGVAIRMLPLGSYKSSLWFHESTWRDLIITLVIVAVSAGIGVFLIWFAG